MDLFLQYFMYFGLGIVLLLIGLYLFEVTTKNKEFRLMAEGKKSASYVLGGRLVGLAIVLYAAIANSISIVDMIIWGTVAIVSQILIFTVIEKLMPKLEITKQIDENNEAIGLFLMLLSVSIGLIIAGCLTY